MCQIFIHVYIGLCSDTSPALSGSSMLQRWTQQRNQNGIMFSFCLGLPRVFAKATKWCLSSFSALTVQLHWCLTNNSTKRWAYYQQKKQRRGVSSFSILLLLQLTFKSLLISSSMSDCVAGLVFSLSRATGPIWRSKVNPNTNPNTTANLKLRVTMYMCTVY